MSASWLTPRLDERVISRLLEQRALEVGDETFLVYGGSDRWTFDEVDRAASQLAGGLRQNGVGHGSTVGLFLPNRPELVNAYFALGKLGAVAVPINTAYRSFMLEHVLNDSRCETLIVDGTYADRLEEVLPSLSFLKTLIVCQPESEPVSAHRALRAIPFGDVAAGSAVVATGRATSNDINCVIYTSGTTGPSKGVLVTNAHGVAKALEVLRICEVTSDDVVYAPLPLFHSFALLRAVGGAVVVGGTCGLRERFSARSYWDDVRHLHATVGYCVFSIPQILAKATPSPSDRENTLRCMLQARYDPAFEERFDLRLIEGYGLTEAGMAMYIRPNDPPKPNSCGRVSDEWEVQLVDDHGVEVPVGSIGEIVLRPRQAGLITPGYLNNDDATTRAFRDAWFHTGDLASRDDDGYYYFRDRKSDSIRRRGENISSWEIETIIRTHPAVADVAAVPYPSDVGEDDVRVVIALDPTSSLEATDLISFCTSRMPDFMIPRYVEFRSELPRTQNGKTEKYLLRDAPLPADCYDREHPAH